MTEARHQLKATVIGSYRRTLPDILRVRKQLSRAGIQVLRPTSDHIISEDPWLRLEGDPMDPELIREKQLAAIRESDFVYVVDIAGFMGSAAMVECGFAYALQIPIYYMEKPYDDAAPPGKIGPALRIVGQLTHELVAPADKVLIEDFVNAHGLQIGRSGAELVIQGDLEAPVLAHEVAGPLAIRHEEGIILRPLHDPAAAAARMQLVSSAHRAHIKTREEEPE